MQTFEDVVFTSRESAQSLTTLLKKQFARKRPKLFLAGGSNKLVVWSEELEIVKKVQLGPDNDSDYDQIYSGAQLSDGRIALGYRNGLVVLVNNQTLEIETILREDTQSIWTVAQLRNGMLVCGGDEGNLRLWNLFHEDGPKCISKYHENSNIRKVIQLWDGRIIFSSFLHSLTILELAHGELKSTGLTAPMSNSAYLRAIVQLDENTLLAAGDEEKIDFYDLRTLQRTRQIALDTTVWNFAPWKDGQYLHAGSSGNVSYYNVKSEEQGKVVVANKYTVGFAATNKYIACGSSDGVIFYDLHGRIAKEYHEFDGQFVRVVMMIK
jgi:WD40 repeat protein